MINYDQNCFFGDRDSNFNFNSCVLKKDLNVNKRRNEKRKESSRTTRYILGKESWRKS